MENGLYNEHELLQRISAGDEEAFTKIFDRYRDGLYALVWSITGSLEMADDILQEVFLKIWLHRGNLMTIGSFKGYLVVIAKRTLFNELRRSGTMKSRERSFSESMPIATYDEIANRLQDKEYQLLLQRGVRELSPQQAQVFQLIKLDGWSRDEAARHLQLSPETVKKHLERAMRTLKAFLLAHLDDAALLLLIFLHV